jgi:hypothetical protein
VSKTAQLNVNSSTYTAVTVATVCKRVTVYEDNQAGTTDYYVSNSGVDANKVTKPAGTKKEFVSSVYWIPNDIPGYIKTASGSVTFAQEEEGA